MLSVHYVTECDPARFARLGTGLLAQVEQSGRPALVLASLTGDALVLGRFQRTSTTVDLEKARQQGLPVVRRLGGGRTIRVGQGTLGVLLGVPDLGSLLPKPVAPDKLLNRYVRGLCAGLATTGAQAHYFGRDYISAERQQLAILSQDGSRTGASVLEAVVGVTRSFEVSPGLVRFRPHTDPRSGGPAHVALSDLLQRPIPIDSVAHAISSAYAKTYKCDLRDEASLFAEGEAPGPKVEEEESSLTASGPREVPIGFVEALVHSDGERIVEARVRGDFIATAWTVQELEESLVGCPLDATQVGIRVDAAFRAPGAALVGVTSLPVFAEAVLVAGGVTP